MLAAAESDEEIKRSPISANKLNLTKMMTSKQPNLQGMGGTGRSVHNAEWLGIELD